MTVGDGYVYDLVRKIKLSNGMRRTRVRSIDDAEVGSGCQTYAYPPDDATTSAGDSSHTPSNSGQVCPGADNAIAQIMTVANSDLWFLVLIVNSLVGASSAMALTRTTPWYHRIRSCR